MSSTFTDRRSEWSSRLATALVEGGYDTQANLAPLVAEANASNQSLAMLLISRGLALPGVVVGALAHLANLPAIDIAAVEPNAEAMAALPNVVAQEYQAVPLQFDGTTLAVAFSEPPTNDDIDALAARVGCRVTPVLGDPVVIQDRLNGVSPPPTIGQAPGSPLVDHSSPTNGAGPTSETEQLLQTGMSMASDGSVPLHVDDLLRYAVSVGASDLHLAAGMPGVIRLHGALRRIEGCPAARERDDPGHGLRHPPRFAARAIRGAKGARHVALHCRCGPVPCQRGHAARHGCGRSPTNPPRDSRVRQVGVARGGPIVHRASPRSRSSSPVRPARGSPPRWLRSSTSSTGRSHSTS